MSTPEITDAQWLQSMRSRYLSSGGEKLVELDEAIRGLEVRPRSLTAFRRLDRLLHNLIGSGGSYGVPEVSDAARQMLQRLKSAHASASGIEPSLVTELHAGMDQLRSVFSDISAVEKPMGSS